MTKYQQHKQQWQACRKCSLCFRRSKVVFARGILPAPILFIGEAPGKSEDVIGKPFIGPAGKLLDRIIERAIDGQYDYVLTNLVCCIPKDSKGDKLGDPPDVSIKACAPRLREFAGLCKPELIVLVGKLPAKWVPRLLKFGNTRTVEIIHPAAILRMDVSQKGLAVQRSIVRLSDAVDEICSS